MYMRIRIYTTSPHSKKKAIGMFTLYDFQYFFPFVLT